MRQGRRRRIGDAQRPPEWGAPSLETTKRKHYRHNTLGGKENLQVFDV
jgi:hypothetical protein